MRAMSHHLEDYNKPNGSEEIEMIWGVPVHGGNVNAWGIKIPSRDNILGKYFGILFWFANRP